MDNRRTLSIIAQGSSAARSSRNILNDDEQNFDINAPNDLTDENLQRRQSNHVCHFNIKLSLILSFIF